MAKQFIASNGVCVSFRARYRDNNYFNIGDRRETPRELTVNDDGSMRLMCDDPLPDAWRVAYTEFKAQEAADFEAWRQKNAHLCLPAN